MNKILIKVIFLLLVLPFLLAACEPLVPQKSMAQKKIVYDNHAYEAIVGNVIMGPIISGEIDVLGNPVISLDGPTRLGLELDLLTETFESISMKLIHCNKDGSPSQLQDMEFLSEINNFRISDFDYSINTQQPYITYRATLPMPSLSGNYLLAVYRRAHPEDLLLTRRFWVYESLASIAPKVSVSNTVSNRTTHQQITYTVSYGSLPVDLPTRNITTMILQNHNGYRAIDNPKPTRIRPNEGVLIYESLGLDMDFEGGNEFRFADLRTMSIAGRNVASISTSGPLPVAVLGTDAPRKGVPYSQNIQDINGRFVIQNNDPGQGYLNADYARVQFRLASKAPIDSKVYVCGRFNDWKMNEDNQMRFDATAGYYYASVYLKQGYYEYLYLIQDEVRSPFYLEGSHLLTENEYEIFVYYRKPGTIFDRLIGYKQFNSIEQ